VTGEGAAAVIASLATLVGVIINGLLQLKQMQLSRSNAEKLDSQGGKIDEVHAATAAIAEQTGPHPTLPPQ
jgi:hypothetical protein